MTTKLLYLTNSYLKTATAKVIDIKNQNGLTQIVLDQTVFYPQGGGQPSDTGEIIGESGQLLVTKVTKAEKGPVHSGQLEGKLKIGEEVKLRIDWQKRYQNMKLHSAGHLLDKALQALNYDLKAVKGFHFKDGPYVEYEGKIPETEREQAINKIEQKLNQIIRKGNVVKITKIKGQDLTQHSDFIHPAIAKLPEVRVVKLYSQTGLPCGGTHLNNIAEIGQIKITKIKSKKGNTRISYQLADLVEKESGGKNSVRNRHACSPHEKTTLKDLKNKIQDLKNQLAKDQDPDLKTKYLGKRGLFNQLAQEIKNIDDKKQAGLLLNNFKKYIENFVETRLIASLQNNKNNKQWVDLTLPAKETTRGHLHPISQAMEEITHIFEKIGFTRVRYPEVDWDYYAFEALNMPPEHPARDEWETFFVDQKAKQNKGQIVLTPHTSNGQVREMERLKKPPIRMINIARCYRRQQDATHTQMFHQFEGLVVDKGINIQHLKGSIDYFASEFYGPGTKSRIRPFHFQFTEPSFEVDFSCHICSGSGKKNGQKCRFCKSGWHEVGGAGMVHPNVLKAGGIDPNKYTGFAFGWGIERTYSLKPGFNLDDIRLLYSSDLRFLRQF